MRVGGYFPERLRPIQMLAAGDKPDLEVFEVDHEWFAFLKLLGPDSGQICLQHGKGVRREFIAKPRAGDIDVFASGLNECGSKSIFGFDIRSVYFGRFKPSGELL